MWEGKVFAAADADPDADAADAAETDWKHKVTPERGDLTSCDFRVVVRTYSAALMIPQKYLH